MRRAIVLLAISGLIGVAVAVPDCKVAGSDRDAQEQLTKSVSAIGFAVRKLRKDEQCKSFIEAVARSADSLQLFQDEKDAASKFEKVTGIIQARAACNSRFALMNTGGLLTLADQLKECAGFRTGRDGPEQLIKSVSAIGFAVRKLQLDVQCESFVGAVARTADDLRLFQDSKDAASKFQKVTELVQSRAEALSKSAPMSNGGLLTLAAQMKDCDGYDSPEAVEERLSRQRLRDELDRKKQDLAAKKALLEKSIAELELRLNQEGSGIDQSMCKQYLGRLNGLNARVDLVEWELNYLGQSQLAQKSVANSPSPQEAMIERLQKMERNYDDVERDLHDWHITAEAHLREWQNCVE